MSLANTLFSAGNKAALPAWILLAVAPEWQWTTALVSGSATLNSANYVANLVLGGGLPDGADFSSLSGVINLFHQGSEHMINAAWIHYLAFDLLVGLLEAKEAVELGIPKLLMVPVLFLTLMLGPSGYLAFQIVKLFWRLRYGINKSKGE